MRGLNFDSATATQDFGFLQEVIAQEILARQQALMGITAPDLGVGIWDPKDPAAIAEGESRPLKVVVNTTNLLTLDVSIGGAFCQSGEWLFTTQLLQNIPLPNTDVGSVFVVNIKRTEPTFDPRLTPVGVGTLINKYISRPGVNPAPDADPLTAGEIAEAEKALIEVVTLATYQAYTTDELADRVTLAVVLVSTGPVLSVDLTRVSYPFNRPWYSPVDIAHRSKVGSGTKTDNNPHALDLGDLSSGELTPYQIFSVYGSVIAKDLDFPKLPGFKCEEGVPQLGILNDDMAGTITGVPGIPGVPNKPSRYVELTNYPVRLVRLVRANDNLELSGFIVPGRNLIGIPPHETDSLTNDLVVTTTAVSAGQPPIGNALTRLTFSAPVEDRKEMLLSRGQAFRELAVAVASLVDYGAIPTYGRVVLNAVGEVVALPNVLVCQTRLDTAGSAEQKVSRTMLAPGRVRIGLTGAVAGPLLTVQIQINGKGADGATLQETLTFGSSWSDSLIPTCAENSSQFKTSSNTYASLTSWQVIQRTNDGINSAIVICGFPNSIYAEAADALPLASFTWDGIRACELRDDRPISLLGMHAAPSHVSPVVAAGMGIIRALSPAPIAWFIEDFAEPRWMDATQSSMDRSFSGLRGPVPVAPFTGTWVSRPLPGNLTQIGGVVANVSLAVYPIPDHRNPETDPSNAVSSLMVRAFQGQGGGVWGAAVAATLGVPVSGATLGGGNAPINRAQCYLTTNNRGDRLKGVAVAIVSS